MPIPVVMKSAFPTVPPKPIYPLPLPFDPQPYPNENAPPAIINFADIEEYPPPYTGHPGKIFSNNSGFLPPGYLVCDGSAISRTDYAVLYKIIGAYYGEGDGYSTFNIPQIENVENLNLVYMIKYLLCADELPSCPITSNTPLPPSINLQVLPFPFSYIPAVGTILNNTLVYVPNGYLACDGSAVAIETYNYLYDMIGTYYGKGDGETTFNLPNLIGPTDPPAKYIIRYDVQIIPCVSVTPNLQVSGLQLDLQGVNIT